MSGRIHNTPTGVDAGFMRLAIAEAQKNLGATDPNPSVGCVLVKDGTVLSAAATARGGRPHAEEQALAAAGDAARGATAYVTLEPCGARSSGSPSCADLLAHAGVARVVVACQDPSSFASGRGTETLTTAGVLVESGVLEAEAALLYAAWFSAHRLQ